MKIAPAGNCLQESRSAISWCPGVLVAIRSGSRARAREGAG